MNDDSISRQAAIDAVYETFCYAYCDNCDKEMNEDLCDDCHREKNNWAASKATIERVINALPSVTPKQRTGKWIDVDVMGMPAQACDQCNTFFPLAYTGGGHHYCPNCGAKMEE